MISGEEDLLAIPWQECFERLEDLLIETVEIVLQFASVFCPRQILIPMTDAAQIERVAAKQQSVDFIFVDKGDDGGMFSDRTAGSGCRRGRPTVPVCDCARGFILEGSDGGRRSCDCPVRRGLVGEKQARLKPIRVMVGSF